MVSGLFIPVIGAFFWKRSSSTAALWSMLLGGGTTIFLIASGISLPLGLDANIYGISISALTFVIISFLTSPSEILSNIELNEEPD